MAKIGRNELCPCDSKKKYKKCCLPVQIVDQFEVSVYKKDRHFITELDPEIESICHESLEQLELGRLNKVKELANNLYAQNSRNYLVNFLLGLCYAKEDKFEQADKYLSESILLFPPFVEAYFNLAEVSLKKVDLVKAVNCFNSVIEIDGEQGEIGKLAAQELKELKEITLKYEGLTLDEYVENLTVFNNAFEALKQHNFEIAINLFSRVLYKVPKHVQSHGNIALAYSAQGKNELAVKHLKKALSIDPDYRPASDNLKIIALLEEGQKLPFFMNEINFYKDGMKSL